MRFVAKKVDGLKNRVNTYKQWRQEALAVIRTEVGENHWAMKPVIKEINSLPHIVLCWLSPRR